MHTVAHTIITPGMPKNPIQLPKGWEQACGHFLNPRVNITSVGTQGAFISTPKGSAVVTFNLYDKPLWGNTTITLTPNSTECLDCIEVKPDHLVFTPKNYTQFQEVKLIYKKDGVVSIDMKASKEYHYLVYPHYLRVCACSGGATNVTFHGSLQNTSCP